jgi:hypothetical protein
MFFIWNNHFQAKGKSEKGNDIQTLIKQVC